MIFKNYQHDFSKRSFINMKEGAYINLQNLKKLTKAPFIIYGDFECVLIPSNDVFNFGPNTKKYQDHIV